MGCTVGAVVGTLGAVLAAVGAVGVAATAGTVALQAAQKHAASRQYPNQRVPADTRNFTVSKAWLAGGD